MRWNQLIWNCAFHWTTLFHLLLLFQRSPHLEKFQVPGIFFSTGIRITHKNPFTLNHVSSMGSIAQINEKYCNKNVEMYTARSLKSACMSCQSYSTGGDPDCIAGWSLSWMYARMQVFLCHISSSDRDSLSCIRPKGCLLLIKDLTTQIHMLSTDLSQRQVCVDSNISGITEYLCRLAWTFGVCINIKHPFWIIFYITIGMKRFCSITELPPLLLIYWIGWLGEAVKATVRLN